MRTEGTANLQPSPRRSRGEGWGGLDTGDSEDLNANLVCFTSGRGVDEHTNAEVDVILMEVSGSGIVTIDGHEHPLSSGMITFVPKGTRRSTRSASEDFAYLTIHRRRGPLQIGAR